MNERYACVCVKEFPAQALLRLRPELRDRACVVMQGNPPLEQVCSLNNKARTLGLMRGMTKVEVETFPRVALLPRSTDEEAAAKAAILECAGVFSPRVEACGNESMFLCVIDIAGTDKLFGPADVLANNLLSHLRKLEIAACIAISSNFHAALAAAKGLTARKPVQVIPAGGHESDALAALPLSVLDMTPEQAETFTLWGIRTLGMLADLPEKELIARMGQPGMRLRRLARGEMPHLLEPVEPEFTLAERMELDSPIEALDALLFVANMMLEQLIVRANSRVLALASVTITLKLEGGATHARTVRPALPTNDRALWLKLLHLDLEAHPPQAAILAASLEAEPGNTSKVQLGLFSPQLPEASRLDVTLARIRAIVGEENVGRAVLKETHEMDAYSIEPFQLPSSKPATVSNSSSRSAVRRLRPAEEIFVTSNSQQPAAFVFRGTHYAVERAYGPWLSSGEWWKQSLWGCEQWDLIARAQDGAMLCCCVVRDVLRNQWQMAGLYD
ncbi:DNA polymerase Y family protein [Occallatibacter riparius]|uniref:DNA polymerase Y family protein n=1 Tax=Occallatibacter riparius TaxID=1002689 RepID=A0A9J7BRZ9_9BACT|nr:DNA polymerase Y family protein [Occallatibacter riparius]UWZ84546.1 DNA polymerase Y family protein [Occallatibacter riparius]